MRLRLFAAVAALSAFAPMLFADPVLTVGSTTVPVGAFFSIPVTITNVSDLFAYQFDLSFDHTELKVTSVTEGPFLATAGATNFSPGTIDNGAGTVTTVADSLSGFIPGANGTGTLVDINFQAISVGTSSVAISVSATSPILLNSSLNDITPTGINPGSVTVTASPVPEPLTWTWTAPLLLALILVRRKRFAAR